MTTKKQRTLEERVKGLEALVDLLVGQRDVDGIVIRDALERSFRRNIALMDERLRKADKPKKKPTRRSKKK